MPFDPTNPQDVMALLNMAANLKTADATGQLAKLSAEQAAALKLLQQQAKPDTKKVRTSECQTCNRKGTMLHSDLPYRLKGQEPMKRKCDGCGGTGNSRVAAFCGACQGTGQRDLCRRGRNNWDDPVYKCPDCE